MHYSTPTPTLYWPVVLTLMALRFGLHTVSNTMFSYGYFTTELYFLDSPMAWGYVEHAPLSVWILKLIAWAFGTSIPVIRIIPAIAGCITIALAAQIARELGGDRIAQTVAGLGVLVMPIGIAMCSFYSMNALESPFWSLAFLLYLKAIKNGQPRYWLFLGLVLGLSLLNKITAFWFGTALLVALLITPERRWLLTRWPWISALIAFGCILPYLIWQYLHDWPMVAIGQSIYSSGERVPPWTLLGQLAMAYQPVTAPLWLAGGFYCLFGQKMKPFRSVGWIWFLVIVMLIAIGTVRYYYLVPVNIIALVAGSLLLEKLSKHTKRHWLAVVFILALMTAGTISAPMSTPLVSPVQYISFQSGVGVEPSNPSAKRTNDLPFHFALRFHGAAILQATRIAFDSLSEIEQRETGILTSEFDEAAAINVLDTSKRLPRARSSHNSYWIWGPGIEPRRHLLVLARPQNPILDHCRSSRRLKNIQCPLCLNYLNDKAVFFCKDLKKSLRTLWPELKDFSNKAVQVDK